LRAHGLANVLFNLPPAIGPRCERGMAAIPGREEEFRASVANRPALRKALRTRACTRWPAWCPRAPTATPAVPPTSPIWAYAAAQAAREGIDVLIEPLNPRDVPATW